MLGGFRRSGYCGERSGKSGNVTDVVDEITFHSMQFFFFLSTGRCMMSWRILLDCLQVWKLCEVEIVTGMNRWNINCFARECFSF